MHPRRLITVGQVLVGISLLLGMAFMGFLVAQRQAGELTAGGFWVGVLLMVLVMSPLLGVGVHVWRRGVIETKEVERMERQRRLLGAIQAHGKIALAELAIQSGMPVEQVRDWIYDLERLGLFTGYIDWQEGGIVLGRGVCFTGEEGLSTLRWKLRPGGQGNSEV